MFWIIVFELRNISDNKNIDQSATSGLYKAVKLLTVDYKINFYTAW